MTSNLVPHVSAIETFKFEDQDDYEYEIGLKVFSRILKIDSPESFILPFFTRKVSAVIFSEGDDAPFGSQNDKTSNI